MITGNFCSYFNFSSRKKRVFIQAFLICLMVVLWPGSVLYGQVDPVAYPACLKREIEKTDNDSVKIEKLFDLAYFYFDYEGEDERADSASGISIRLAEESHLPELIVMAYCRYIESNNLFAYYSKALGYGLKAEQLSTQNNPGIFFRIARNIVSVYLSGYDYDKALAYAYKSLSLATTTENPVWKAESYLDIGRSLEGKNQKIEAFRNYLNATELAERIKDTSLLNQCFSRLSKFYNLNKLYRQATHYKLLQSDLLRKTKPVDSVALVWTMYDLQVIDLNSNANRLEERSMQKILAFAVRKKHNRLLKDEIDLIRTHLIEADRIDLLHDLYYNQFPQELQKMANENPGLYYKLRASFCEEEKKPDSALFFFNKAAGRLRNNPNKILRANFFNRFGQFYLRQGRMDKAIEEFAKSYELASEAAYFDYMLVASGELEALYARKNDYRDAYHYALLNKALSDSVNNMSKKDQMLVMEIDHETRQRELASEQERQSTLRRHYLQYNAILIIIIAVFIVLLMLGSLKVPEWITRSLGFFSFIFLFEFIVLIADHKIHEVTQDEPWKVLVIKIILIGILLPFHEWIEKRVVSFLLNPALINISRYPVRSKLREHLGKLKKK